MSVLLLYSSPLSSTVPTTVLESYSTDKNGVYTNINTLIIVDRVHSPTDEVARCPLQETMFDSIKLRPTADSGNNYL